MPIGAVALFTHQALAGIIGGMSLPEGVEAIYTDANGVTWYKYTKAAPTCTCFEVLSYTIHFEGEPPQFNVCTDPLEAIHERWQRPTHP